MDHPQNIQEQSSCQSILTLPDKAKVNCDIRPYNKEVLKIKKKVVLFRACEYQASMYNPPYGILQIAACLLKANYEVIIIDGDRMKDPVTEASKYINSENIVCAGVSCIPGSIIIQALNFSKYMKEHNIPVIWGGTSAGVLTEQTLNNPFIDFIIKGEGEETFLELVENIDNREQYKDIKGIGYKDIAGKIHINQDRPYVDLNKLDPIPYHLIDDFEQYLKPSVSLESCKRVHTLYTHRGCYFKCTFCYISLLSKSSWRSLTPENIIKQIKLIKEKFDIDGIKLAGDNFFMDKEVARKTAELMIKENLSLKWFTSCTVATLNTFDKEYCEILKKSGLETIHVGVEVGSNRMLEHVKKGTTIEGILRFSEQLTEFGIKAKVFFMIGLPFETKEDVLQTLELMDKLDENPYIYVPAPNIYCPWPGTQMFNEAVRFGFIPPKNLEDWSRIGTSESSILPFTKEHHDFLLTVLFYWKLRSFFNNGFFAKILKSMKFVFFHNSFTHTLIVSMTKSNATKLERFIRRYFYKVG